MRGKGEAWGYVGMWEAEARHETVRGCVGMAVTESMWGCVLLWGSEGEDWGGEAWAEMREWGWGEEGGVSTELLLKWGRRELS